MTTSVLSVTNRSLEGIVLCAPESGRDGFFCEIKSAQGDILCIQTPKFFFKKNEDSIDIIFNNLKGGEHPNEFYKIVRSFENYICDELSKNSLKWFSKNLTTEVVRGCLFKSCISLPDNLGETFKMRVSVNKEDTEIYNTNKQQVSIEELEGVAECTFLISAKEVYITPTQAQVMWELVQVLIHKKKSLPRGFGIKHEEHTPGELQMASFTPVSVTLVGDKVNLIE